MEPMSLAYVAEVLEAQVIGNDSGEITGICTNTRQIQPGALFFALQGENSDGHAYLAKAFAGGAKAAVVSRPVENAGGTLLLVPDTLRALGDLALHYRRQFSLPVIGVTGSVGKTSTKEMIAAVLRTTYKTLANEKNYNNEIGVPLTLFQLNREHEVAVIEMGMRAAGEIDRLAEIAQPTMGLITNIGYAHIERLGSRERLAEAKSELLARLPSDGIAILPCHDTFFDTLKCRVPSGCRILTYGDGMTQFTLNLQAPGTHHRHNALAALTVANILNIHLDSAIKALESWTGAEGRMVVRPTCDGLTVLDDCYNAGPESMAAALNTLQTLSTGHRIAVLGDMRELGDFAPEAHRLVGQVAAVSGLDCLITVGALAGGIADEVIACPKERAGCTPQIYRFDSTDAAAAEIRTLVQPGDTVLVKGSRAMEMEKIVTVLTGEAGGAHHG